MKPAYKIFRMPIPRTYSPSHSDKQSIFSGNNFSHNFTENDYSYYNMNSSQQQASSSYGSETIYISSSDDHQYLVEIHSKCD